MSRLRFASSRVRYRSKGNNNKARSEEDSELQIALPVIVIASVGYRYCRLVRYGRSLLKAGRTQLFFIACL
jgi:hypothetical protein